MQGGRLQSFHLACPFTSLPLCHCRLYRRAPPNYALRAASGASSHSDPKSLDAREATRQRLLHGLMAGAVTGGSISPDLARAVHAKARGARIIRGPERALAALVDAAEVAHDENRLRERVEAAEAAERRRTEEERRRREEQRERERAEAEIAEKEREKAVLLAAEKEKEEEIEIEQIEEEKLKPKSKNRKRDRERERKRKRERKRERDRLRER